MNVPAEVREEFETWLDDYIIAWERELRAKLEEEPRWEPVGNAFCPTGKGGGVDPSCSPGGGGPRKLPSRDAAAKAPQADVDKIVRGVEKMAGEANLVTVGKIRRAAQKLGWSDDRIDLAIRKASADGRISLKIWEGFDPVSKRDKEAGFQGHDPSDPPFLYLSPRRS